MATHKNGSALIIVMVFLIVTAITSIGLYNSVYLSGKMQGINEVRRIRGYYAALGALRYIVIIGPAAASSGSVKANYNQLWIDLGLTGSEDVTITRTGPVMGEHTVTATYSY